MEIFFSTKNSSDYYFFWDLEKPSLTVPQDKIIKIPKIKKNNFNFFHSFLFLGLLIISIIIIKIIPIVINISDTLKINQ